MKRAPIIATAMLLLLPGMPMAQPAQQGSPGAGAPSKPGGTPGRPTTQPRPPGNGSGTPPGRPGNGGGPSRPNPPGRPNPPSKPQPPKPQPPRPQPPKPQPPKPQPPRPHPPRPQPPKPQPPRPQPGHPPGGRPPGHRPPPNAQPLPPKGNQYWHRGHYYGRIRGPAFVYPPGWHYRRWTIGVRLPPLFLTPTYLYPGWAALGLGPPPPGYVWVRFGPDLLEVNLSTGEVEDVVYGVFL